MRLVVVALALCGLAIYLGARAFCAAIGPLDVQAKLAVAGLAAAAGCFGMVAEALYRRNRS